jgi:bis(5'-nucleosidyl)-tetraphosphatase
MNNPMHHNDFAAGVIVFHVDGNGALTYLVIKSAGGHWELPKGHAEPNETWRQTAVRELKEETGIHNIQLIPDFARQIRYVFRDRKSGIVYKIVCFALGQTQSTMIQLSHEHSEFAFLAFEPAVNRLTHSGTRAVLRDADEFLQRQAAVLQSSATG